MKQMNTADIIAKAKNNYLNDIQLTEAELNELTESIRQDGIKVPLLIQKKTNVLIDGYNRLAIAKKLKLTEVPVEIDDIKDDEIEKTQIVLQVGRRNLKDADRKQLIGKLINLKKITADDAPKMGVSKNGAKFAAKVDTIATKSKGKLSPKEIQKLVKVKGIKGAEEDAVEVAKSTKSKDEVLDKKIIRSVQIEKKTKMSPQQILEKPMKTFEEIFDDYPQHQAEFKKILKSFIDSL